MDLKEIQNLIKFVAKSGASEVKLEMEDVKITIRTGSDTETTIVQQMPISQQMPQQGIPIAQPEQVQVSNTETPVDSEGILLISTASAPSFKFFRCTSLAREHVPHGGAKCT